MDNENWKRVLPTTSQSLLKHNPVIIGEFWRALRSDHGSHPLKSLHTTADIYNNHREIQGFIFSARAMNNSGNRDVKEEIIKEDLLNNLFCENEV